MSNPFMGRAPTASPAASEQLDTDPVLGSALAARGPQVPPLSLPPGAAGPEHESTIATEQPWLWLLGLHGGCGVSTVRELFPVPKDVVERTTWPIPDEPGYRSRVLLVARTHARGLDRLTQAAAQWAGDTFPHVDLIGTVLVADGPKPSKAQHDRLRHATSLTPMTWHIGWHESWRALTADDARPVPLRLHLTISAICRRIAQTPSQTPIAASAREAG